VATREIKINGVSYPTIVAACQSLKVKRATYYRRVSHGETVMQALGLSERPPSKNSSRKPYTLLGVTYASFAEACRTHGLNRTSVMGRLSGGWTTKEAFGLKPRRLQKKILPVAERDGTKGVFVIQGHKFFVAPKRKAHKS
jgi:hypothetical protein